MFLLIVTLTVGPIPLNASALSSDAIQSFQQAWAELDGNADSWVVPSLADSPLQIELHIESLRRSSELPPADIRQALLSDYAAHASVQRLRRHWLLRAWQVQDYPAVTALYRPTDGLTTQCTYRLARAALGRINTSALHSLYVAAPNRGACGDLIATADEQQWVGAWSKAERMKRLLKLGQYNEAQALADALGPQNTRLAADWIQARQDPETYLDRQPEGQHRKAALRRLINKAPDRAGVRLQPDERDLQEWRAVHLILDRDPEVDSTLDELARPLQTRSLKEWEARHLLIQEDWPRLLKRIQAFPPSLKDESLWRYWNAHAQEKTGQQAAAQQAFQALAQRTSYYGFLAADRLGRAYRLPRPHPSAANGLGRLTQRYEIQIAMDLLTVGQNTLARQQWRSVWPTLTGPEKKLAAALALQLQWPNEEIRAAVNAGLADTLHLYPDALRPVMQNRQIDPDWLLGLTRTESLFQPDAKSRAGALGLMQILPSTGKRQAKVSGVTWRGDAGLLVPDVNITLGADYLAAMFKQFEQSPAAATAAYNAGPNAVKRWLPAQAIDPVLWVETIPFKETRNYVKKVLFAATLYNQTWGKRDRLLSDRMAPIPIRND